MAIGVGDSPGKRKVKRPRTEDSRGEQVTRTTNPDLWFNDGSIILVARGVAFRVYKDLLAKSSRTFQEMFTRQQPDPPEKIEGCHIVHLDDSPLDVANMLKLVFFGTQLYPSDEQVGFPFVASWIKMAHKYRMEGTLALALKRLKSFFSDDLDDWIRASKHGETYCISVEPQDAISAVKLARLTGTTTILPSALYMCSQLSSKELLHGVALADGAMERLDDKDIQMCMDARNVLTGRTILSVLEIWALPVSSGCYDEDACQRALEAEVDVTRLEDRWLADGVTILSRGAENLVSNAALCSRCSKMVRSRMKLAQQRHWASLSQMFGVWTPLRVLNRSGTRPRGSDVGENDDQDDDATQGTADDVPSDNESAGEDANEGDVHEEDATAKDANEKTAGGDDIEDVDGEVQAVEHTDSGVTVDADCWSEHDYDEEEANADLQDGEYTTGYRLVIRENLDDPDRVLGSDDLLEGFDVRRTTA